jgi:dolichol-phosphate mannosyltransferase
MNISTGDVVVFLDGDLQDPPEVISDFFKRWKEGYEVVYGRRIKRDANALMNACFKLFYRLFNWSAYITIPVDAGDFSMMDRRVVNEILTFPETDQFLRGLRAWVGFKQTNVDYIRPKRAFGESTNNWLRNIWWARKGIFSFSFLPLDLLFYGGIGLTTLSVVAMGGQIAYRILFPSMPHGIATVIVLILFFGGLQLMGISVLGEYLGKTLEEAKHRPKFIRRAIRRGKRLFRDSHEMDQFIKNRLAPRP